MAGDTYAAVDDLVVRLRANRADRWADAINDAVESGATTTEILMALRHRIDDLVRSGEASAEALQQARRLKKDLNELLAD